MKAARTVEDMYTTVCHCTQSLVHVTQIWVHRHSQITGISFNIGYHL